MNPISYLSALIDRSTRLPLPLAVCSILLAVSSLAAAPAPKEPPKRLASDSPVLTFSPASLNMGKLPVGDESRNPRLVTLTNTGDAAINIQFLKMEGVSRGQFGIKTNTCGTTIEAGASCTLGIIFAPGDYGSLYAFVYIVDNAGNSPQAYLVYGQGVH